MICLKDGSITVSSKQLILGSGSPRRRELLAVLGLHPADVRAPDVDETPRKGELPRSYCNRITASKAEALPAAADEVILCADTTVALGRRIMGKPADRDEARAFLQKLSGRRHKVITAVAVKTTERIWQKDVVSTVQMKRLSPQELEGYLATDLRAPSSLGFPAPTLRSWACPCHRPCIYCRPQGSIFGGNYEGQASCSGPHWQDQGRGAFGRWVRAGRSGRRS